MLIIALIAALVLGVSIGFGASLIRAFIKSLKAWWHYKKVCVPVSLFLLMPPSLLLLAPGIPSGIIVLLLFLIQFVIQNTALVIFERRLKNI